MKNFLKSTTLLLMFVCTGCFSKEQQNEKRIDDTVIPVEHEYEEISEFELTWETMFDVDENNYYVYFYSMTCNHCQELKNYIIEKAQERGNIYFVKGSSKNQLTNDSNKLIGAENPGDFYILGYPTLALISNKKCTKNLAGITQIKTELK